MMDAYNEKIIARCEEILNNDEEYQKLNREILLIEKKIKERCKDNIDIFLEYERLIIQQQTLSFILIGKTQF